LFSLEQKVDLSINVDSVQRAMGDFQTFNNFVKLVSFLPFPNPDVALENLNSISDSEVNEFLENFLESNIKGKKINLGVSDLKLGGNITSSLEIKCYSDPTVFQIVRGLRKFFTKFLKQEAETEIKSQLGLGHSYSR
jgi:nucleolar protein 56